MKAKPGVTIGRISGNRELGYGAYILSSDMGGQVLIENNFKTPQDAWDALRKYNMKNNKNGVLLLIDNPKLGDYDDKS